MTHAKQQSSQEKKHENKSNFSNLFAALLLEAAQRLGVRIPRSRLPY